MGFCIWHQIYFKPIAKRVFFQRKFFALQKQVIQRTYEISKARYESNSYKSDDPSKKAYYEILKELDADVIENFSLLQKNLECMGTVQETQKAIWQRCSCEKIREFEGILSEYEYVCSSIYDYIKRRSEIYYRYEKSIKDAYKIDLQVTRYSVLSKLSLSLLMYLVGTNLYALAIPFLPEALKILYQEVAGYKSLIKASEKYLRIGGNLISFLDLYKTEVDDAQIRNW